MRLILTFARMYPKQSLITLGCLLLAAVAEGLGLSTLLPLLGLATSQPGSAEGTFTKGSSPLSRMIGNALSGLGLELTIGTLLIVIVAAMFLKAGLMLLAQKRVGYTVAKVATDLRLALLRAVLSARWSYYLRQPVGGFSNAFATEANRASQAYLHGATIMALVLETLLYLTIAATVSWQFTLSAALVGLLIVGGLGGFVRMTRRAGKRQTSLLKALLARLTDVLFAVKPLKAMARADLIGHLLEKETRQLNRALQRDVVSKEAVKALQEPLVVSALAGGLYIALTFWALPLNSLIMMALLFGRTLSSINKVQKQYQQMVAGDSAFWSLRETIARAEAEREDLPPGTSPSLCREISLQDVTLSYGNHVVLRSASLQIPVGQITAIIGPSGAGKTSIADVIVGLIRPQSGEVFLDDMPLRTVDLRAWRQAVGYMPQETFLLHESIFTNVTLGDRTLTEDGVEAALRAAEAWDFIAPLPEGMHTPVGERGARFSGGQRQRIAIARALIHKPQLLILDEATAALDPASEAAICETVRKLRGTMTILVISHQPALLQVADLVYRLENGNLITVEHSPQALSA
ncbi:MAG: ABC transporter ATP-binding protein [Deltaproteobacteria bacterium]|nr:ABC transporter ATP-binding protein [Deltaproteobacteria bacterium]